MFTRTCSLTLLSLLVVAADGWAAEVRGLVSKVDPAKNVLVLEARGRGLRGRALTFVVTPETQVLFGQRAGQLRDLLVGKRVRVSYEVRDGRYLATSIRALGLRGLGAPAQPNQAGDTVVGELRRVAFTDRELVVIGPGNQQETILAVPDDMTVTKHGKPARFEDLREGERAVVRFGQRDGKATALAVEVGESVAAAPENRIQKIRRVLKLVDLLLDLADRAKPREP